jgi:hypothetical protein
MDTCTLMADRNLINRRNVKVDPHTAYRPDRDFIITEVTARVIVAAMKVLGIESLSSDPLAFPIPANFEKEDNYTKLKFLHQASAKVVDEIVIDQSTFATVMERATAVQDKELSNNQQLNEDGRFPCRYPECPKSYKYDGKARRKHEASHNPPVVVPEEPGCDGNNGELAKDKEDSDDVYNYNCALVSEGLLFMNFLDAIAEGDGERIFRQYKYLMLLFKSDAPHSNKYALESLYQLLLVKGVLSKRDALRFIWNRSVNNKGGLGMNIPLDLAVEHSNNFLKQSINHLGVNLTENAVTRISKAEAPMRGVMDNIDRDLKRIRRSGKHKKKSSVTDMNVLIGKLTEEDVFSRRPGRGYKHFKNFERSPICWLNMSKIYTWINKHKDNMSIGTRGR